MQIVSDLLAQVWRDLSLRYMLPSQYKEGEWNLVTALKNYI